jgi:hypothetical protein
MTIKKVKWRDSRLHIQQEPPQEWSVCIIESVGYLIQEDKDKVVLAGDLIEGEYRRVIVIPTENIVA